MLAAHLCREAMAVALDQPALVIGLLPGDERQAKLFDGVEGADPQELFLECADDALGTAVALGRTHERRVRFDAPEGDLILEVLGAVYRLRVAGEDIRFMSGLALKLLSQIRAHVQAVRLADEGCDGMAAVSPRPGR